MDVTGITWLDWSMAVLTVLGFVATGYGIFLAWRQARKATTAADRAREAISTTRSELVTRDLMSELRSTRKAIADVEAATERNEPEIAKFTLLQLADSMRRAVALARDHGSPDTDEAVIEALDTLSREASTAKADLARRPTVKVRTVTGAMFPRLSELSHRLLDIETTQKYAITEEP